MSESTQTTTAWLSADDLNTIRGSVPIVYVEAVPVRLDELGRVTHVGLLLRMTPDGEVNEDVFIDGVVIPHVSRRHLKDPDQLTGISIARHDRT